MEQTILSQKDDAVLILKLNRPEKFNSFNRKMALELQDYLLQAASDNQIRAILLTGNGKAFCAGQDLSEAVGDDSPGIETIVREHYNPIIMNIRNLAKPVVCAVNGVAAGAGANIALACDIVIAAHSASFIQAFSKIALIPDSGGTFFLPRLIGFQKASALMMLGDKVSATQAEQMGMIYKSVADDQLYPESLTVAQTLSAMPTKALGLTKKLLNASMHTDLESQLKNELHEQVNAAQSFDYQEGVNAFLQKRKPNFKGQ